MNPQLEVVVPASSIMKTLFASLFARGIEPLLIKALALKPRGGVANDKLVLSKVSGRLELEWHARDIHPWDRDLPACRQAELHFEQALRDADLAIQRVFRKLPEIERIEIRILDTHDSTKVILAGTVTREDAFAAGISSSSKMRLMMMGVRLGRIVGARVEPLSMGPTPAAPIDYSPGGRRRKVVKRVA
ncbi:MAG TPA: hypothetical protein VE641_04805 [Chthoniobacterales bacterium]|nr:hypothetical protein [Chthoniobacterales bacterium]